MAEKAQRKAEKLQQASEKCRNKLPNGVSSKQAPPSRSPVEPKPPTPSPVAPKATPIPTKTTDAKHWGGGGGRDDDPNPNYATQSPIGGFLHYQEERLRTDATNTTPSTAPTSVISTEPSFVNLTASSFAPPVSQAFNLTESNPLLFPDPDDKKDTADLLKTQGKRYDAPPQLFDDSDFDAFQQPYPPAAAAPYGHHPGYPPNPMDPYYHPYLHPPPPSPGYDPRFYMGPRPMPPYGWHPYMAHPLKNSPHPHTEMPQGGVKPWGYGHEPTHLYVPDQAPSPPPPTMNLERPTALWSQHGHEEAHKEAHGGRSGVHNSPEMKGGNKDIGFGQNLPGIPQRVVEYQSPRKFDRVPSGKHSLVCRLGIKLMEMIQPPVSLGVTGVESSNYNVHRPPPAPADTLPRHLSSVDLGHSGGTRRQELFSAEVITCEMLPEQRILYDVLNVIAQKQAQAAQASGDLNSGTLSKAVSNLRLAANSIDLLDVELRSELRHLAERYMSQLRPAHIDGAILQRIQKLYNAAKSNRTLADTECPICLCMEAEVVTECNHHFHRDCLFDWLDIRHHSCPMCRRPIDIDKVTTGSRCAIDKTFTQTTLLRLDGDVIQDVSSNKITQAFKEIASIHDQFLILRNMDSNTPVPKIVVFCSIKPMLIALSHLAAAIGIGHFWLIAGAEQSVSEREVDLFKSSQKTSILLSMPRASSNKIDLSFACSVFILDPWKKTKCFELGMGMVFRSKQKVRLIKFMSEKSVETEAMNFPMGVESVDVAASKLLLA